MACDRSTMSTSIGVRRYGTTQARVLDQHLPTSTVPRERRIAAFTRMLEFNDYHYQRASCERPQRALAEYQGYKKLFGERLYASKYPDTTSDRELVKFTRLPGELRNRVYRLHLLQDRPIELLPKTSRDSCNGPLRILNQAYKHYRYIIQPSLRLLRVSSTINAEASSIFYGENIFRFTNEAGWYYLRGFLDTIGKANVKRLRHLSVHVPWKGMSTNKNSGGSWVNYAEPETIQMLLSRRGLLPEDAECPPAPIPRCLEMLAAAGTLTRLDLALPYTYRLHGFPEELPINLKSFKGELTITLVHLRNEEVWEEADHSQVLLRRTHDKRERGQMIEYGEIFDGVKGFVRELGWQYELMEYDFYGKYSDVL